jgi:hypothetical protein
LGDHRGSVNANTGFSRDGIIRSVTGYESKKAPLNKKIFCLVAFLIFLEKIKKATKRYFISPLEAAK